MGYPITGDSWRIKWSQCSGQQEFPFERTMYCSCKKAHSSINRYFYKVREAPVIYYTVIIMNVEERWTKIGTGARKGYYEDLQNRVSKENETLFNLKRNKSAFSNGYTFSYGEIIHNGTLKHLVKCCYDSTSNHLNRCPVIFFKIR